MTVSFDKTSSKSSGRLFRLLWAVAVLNIFDLISTCYLVSLYGIDIEFNPLMRSLFAAIPIKAAVFKLALLILYLILIPLAARSNYTLAYRGSQFVVLVYILVVFAHMVVYYQI
jgi:magnesium-transporting ATPase (P-type)